MKIAARKWRGASQSGQDGSSFSDPDFDRSGRRPAVADLYCVDVSVPVTDEFRDLERPKFARRKDAVLMATVTSFETLARPSRSELRQFAELFVPLFSASSPEARRDAVAALSQSKSVPPAAAFFIGNQPIAIAAPFLAASPCLSDEALITIARTQGEDYARAIVRRESLSPTVIDALVGLRHNRAASPSREDPVAEQPRQPTGETADASLTVERAEREENLRRQIREIAAHIHRPTDDRLGLRNFSPIQEALLVRFARSRQTGQFSTVLADTLASSRWLSDRILLDISGQQLATVLKGLAMNEKDALFILTRFYDHLESVEGEVALVEHLWRRLDENQCGMRVEAWRRADSYTYAEPRPKPVAIQAEGPDATSGRNGETQRPANGPPLRLVRTTASRRAG